MELGFLSVWGPTDVYGLSGASGGIGLVTWESRVIGEVIVLLPLHHPDGTTGRHVSPDLSVLVQSAYVIISL